MALLVVWNAHCVVMLCESKMFVLALVVSVYESYLRDHVYTIIQLPQPPEAPSTHRALQNRSPKNSKECNKEEELLCYDDGQRLCTLLL